MTKLCEQALDKLGALSREVHVEVYSCLDVLTEARILVRFSE